MGWTVKATNEVDEWLDGLPEAQQDAIYARIELLTEYGPTLGRPAVETLDWSTIHNLKELRAKVGRNELRVLFVFDPSREAILLIGGNKTGKWNRWYREAIPRAERRYEEHLDKLRNQ